jgi:TonB-linked SusC/RagA family outer membrane protein
MLLFFLKLKSTCMKSKIYTWLVGLFLLLGSQAVWAQRITGTVVAEEDGLGIPGISVLVKGSTKATITDLDGKFTIDAKAGETLVFSLVGYKQQEMVVVAGKTDIAITMQGGTQELGTFVTTALGMKEDQRKLNTSIAVVKGEDIAETQRDNFLDALQGRVAGLQAISSSGTAGASTLVQLRGVSSIGGNNQPLMVVDGLPIDNSTFSQGALTTDAPNRSNDYTNRASDINPNDIASVTVLKGPEAAALYGSQGSSGAIIITTKRGSKGKGKINYDNSFSNEEVTRLPKLQNQYIRGFNGTTDVARTAVSFFGPAKPDSLQVFDNLGNFFQTGHRQAHNLSFEAGSDKLSYRFSTNYNKREATIPNTGSTLISARLSGTAKLVENLDLNTSIFFTSLEFQKPLSGDWGATRSAFFWPWYEDITKYLNTDGTRRRLLLTDTELDNPFFSLYNNVNKDRIRSTYTNTGLTWTPTKWLTLAGRFGANLNSIQGNLFLSPNSNIRITSELIKGGFIENYVLNTRSLNSNFVATAKKTFGDFGVSVNGGVSADDNNTESNAFYGENLLDPTFNSINNVTQTTVKAKLRVTNQRLLGAFGKIDLSYKDMLYVTASGRNDWSSTLPIANRSYFYPSVSAGFTFTELPFMKENAKWFTYGKLRAAYSKSGKDAQPYKVATALAVQTTTGGGFIYDVFGGNPDLKPEFVTGQELGADLKFFNNRVRLDVTYFSNDRSNQIASQRLSYGTGFILGLLNSGSFNVKGWEALLGLTIIKTKDVNWDLSFNFTKNSTTVTSLPADVNEFYNSDTWLIGNARASAFNNIDFLRSRYPGVNLDYNQRGAGTATAIGGYSYLRNNNGDVLISPSSGLPVVNSNFLPIGDRQPDFTLGIINRVTYKAFTLGFNVDLRKGGDVFNGNELSLFRNGLSTRILDRTQPYTFKGVLRDGKENTTPTANTIQITPQTRSDFYGAFAESDFIEKNINWLRLKDITLTYVLPKALLKKLGVLQGLSVFATGTDLYLLTNYTGGDPATNGTTATSGGVGAWGIDYGKIGAPRSIAFGLRATLQ